MKNYVSGTDAISDLHTRGFINDFQLFGNDLLWVQGQLFIRTGEFTILEHYKITVSEKEKDELVVFGIIAPHHNIKGILINHYKSYTTTTPPVIVKKLNELKICHSR